MRILPALVIAASLAAPPVFADEDAVGLKPEQIGQIFCLSRTGSDEGAISGLLTPELAAAIADFRQDEIAHRDTAIAHGAEQTPGYALMRGAIKAGCRAAIWLSERI